MHSGPLPGGGRHHPQLHLDLVQRPSEAHLESAQLALRPGLDRALYQHECGCLDGLEDGALGHVGLSALRRATSAEPPLVADLFSAEATGMGVRSSRRPLVDDRRYHGPLLFSFRHGR